MLFDFDAPYEPVERAMNFFHTNISPKAIDLVMRTLRSTQVSEDRLVRPFESALENTLGVPHAVAVNNGTSALHLSLALAGVGPGDAVILPAQTFVATGLVILIQRAKPVFADIPYQTGNLDPVSIRQKITERTGAVMAVHWGGYPCDMDALRANAFYLRTGDSAPAVAPDPAGGRLSNPILRTVGSDPDWSAVFAVCYRWLQKENNRRRGEFLHKPFTRPVSVAASRAARRAGGYIPLQE